MNGRVQRTLLFASLLLAAMPPSPAGAGGGCHMDQEQSAQPAAGSEVRMERMCFGPAVLRVDPGATVRFSNQDPVGHVALGTGWGSGELIPPGGTFEHRFLRRGTYAYSCNLHPGMNGAIVVADAVAATGAVVADVTAPGASGAEAELASTSSPASAGPDVRLLALGGLAGALLGSLITGRWAQRRRRT